MLENSSENVFNQENWLKIVLLAFFLVSAISPAAAALRHIDTVTIDVSDDKVNVGESVTVNGNVEGSGLTAIRAAYREKGDTIWNVFKSEETSCSGSHCSIEANFPAESYTPSGRIEFQIKAEAGKLSENSVVKTVEFGEKEVKSCNLNVRSFSLDSTHIKESGNTRARLTVDNLDDSISKTVTVKFFADGNRFDTDRSAIGGGGRKTFTSNSIGASMDSDGDGRIVVKAKVSCGTGFRETRIGTLSVEEKVSNQAPKASFSFSPSSPGVSDTVTFDASGSSDPDGSIVKYTWDMNSDGVFGDRSGRTATWSFSSPRDHVVRLKVKDDSGRKDTASRTVSVREKVTGGNLKVKVLDSSGNPLDAKVTASNSDSRQGSTGSDGRIRFSVEEGNYDVTASKNGYRPGKRHVFVTAGETTRVTLRLRKKRQLQELDARLEVHPSPAKTGETVVFDARGSTPGSAIDEYWFDIDADGFFEVKGNRKGFVKQEFSRARDRRASVKVLDQTTGRSDTASSGYRVVQRQKERDETGDLEVDVEDGGSDGLENARVEIDNGDDRVRFTGSGGEARFNRLETGDYDVEVTCEGETETGDVRVQAGRTAEKGIEFDKDFSDDFCDDEERDDAADDGPGEGLRISGVSAPSSVCRGGSFTATVTARNDNGFHDLVTLSGSGLGSIIIGPTFTMQEDEVKTRSIKFTNVQGSGQERFHVQVDNHNRDSATGSIKVRSCDVPDREAADIAMEAEPSTVAAGQPVKVTGFVDGVTKTTEVDVFIGGRRAGRALTQPDGFFQVFVTPEQVGKQTVTARASGVASSATIEVLPTVSVTMQESPDKAFRGETFQVCGNVESQVTPRVYLQENGRIISSKNAEGNVCFDVRAKEEGDYRYTIVGVARGSRSTASTEVEVLETGPETTSFPDQVASVESGSGIVKVELYNTHDSVTRYQLSLSDIPRTWVSQSHKEVVLDTGERETVFFYLTPKDEGDFTALLEVESRGSVIHRQGIDISSVGTVKRKTLVQQLIDRVRFVF